MKETVLKISQCTESRCLVSVYRYAKSISIYLLILYTSIRESMICLAADQIVSILALSTSLEKLAIDEGKIRTLEDNITSLQRDLVRKYIYRCTNQSCSTIKRITWAPLQVLW